MRRSIGRRRLFKAAIAFGVASAVGSVAVFVRTRGYVVPAGTRLVALDAWEWIVVREMARRVCEPDRDGVVTADDVDVAGFVDAFAAKMPAKMRRDVGRFLGYVEHLAPIASGHTSRFSKLAPADQKRVLEAVASDDNHLLRGGFDGVKSLLFMGYYRDPRTWSVIGYDGPLVSR